MTTSTTQKLPIISNYVWVRTCNVQIKYKTFYFWAMRDTTWKKKGKQYFYFYLSFLSLSLSLFKFFSFCSIFSFYFFSISLTLAILEVNIRGSMQRLRSVGTKLCERVCVCVCMLGICENVGVAKKWHWTRQDQVAHSKKNTKIFMICSFFYTTTSNFLNYVVSNFNSDLTILEMLKCIF